MKKLQKKLTLNKLTISKLSDPAMGNMVGGTGTDFSDDCCSSGCDDDSRGVTQMGGAATRGCPSAQCYWGG